MVPARYLTVVAGADPDAVDTLAAALRDEGTVRTAYTVDALFDTIDGDVDVVLVDSGLTASVEGLVRDLRDCDAAFQVGVIGSVTEAQTLRHTGRVDVILTADPDEVRVVVSRLATRAQYRDRLDQYYALAEERATLSDEEDSAAVDRLDRQIDRLRHDLDAQFRRLDGSAFDAALGPAERALDTPDSAAADTDDTDSDAEGGGTGADEGT